MLRRLLILIIPCVFAAAILSWVAWQRFDASQAQQQIDRFESVLGAEDPSPETVLVTRVIDGDTIELETGEKVRYIGIDTPETQHPSLGKECFGPEAAARNRELVEGKQVRLEQDISQIDRYDRLLRYVWIEDVQINELLVKDGYAFAKAYPPDTKYQSKLEAAENWARNTQAGLWTACPAESP